MAIVREQWPDDCMLQWGDSGAVFPKNGKPYTTAFFEAFPKTPSTFIRGEGKTVEEAEQDAKQQFDKILACKEHEFEKRHYENGGGMCKHCELFRSDVFEPTPEWIQKCEESRQKLHEMFTHLRYDEPETGEEPKS